MALNKSNNDKAKYRQNGNPTSDIIQLFLIEHEMIN